MCLYNVTGQTLIICNLAEPAQDLLGDYDESAAAENATIHANAVEIGNLQNQATSTQRSLKTTQEGRKTLEETVAAQASQLSALQSQLATATAAYETEKKLLETLQERMAAQNTEIQTTREALIRTESDVSATRLEKAEIEGAVLRDKEEIRDLQRKMKEVTTATEVLKAEIEKGKKDARQQKGLLAIAKKQLAASETDREKALKELEEAKLELAQIQKEVEETEAKTLANNTASEAARSEIVASKILAPAEVSAIARIPDTPDVKTPLSGTSTRSTNPFDKLNFGGSGSTSPKADSPFQPFASLALPVEPEQPPPAPAKGDPSDPFGFGSESRLVSEPAEVPKKEAQSVFDAEFGALSATPVKPEHPKSDVDSISSVEEKFPDLDASVTTTVSPPRHVEELAPIKEVDHPDESDSSDDEPFHSASAAPRDIFAVTPLASASFTEGATNGTAVPAPQSVSAFDDVFAAVVHDTDSHVALASKPPAHEEEKATLAYDSPASVTSSPKSAANETLPFEPLSSEQPAPPPTIEAVLDGPPGATAFDEAMGIIPPSGRSGPVGASAFDEAMGIIPASSAPQGEVKFQSKFDDSFDFGEPMPLVTPAVLPTGVPPLTNGAFVPPPVARAPVLSNNLPALPPPPSTSSFNFDNTFGVISEAKPLPDTQGNGNGRPLTSAFDDVFAPSQPTLPSAAPVATPPAPAPVVDTGVDHSVDADQARSSSSHATSPPLSPSRLTSGRSSTPPPRGSSPVSSNLARRKSMSAKSSPPEEKKSRLGVRLCPQLVINSLLTLHLDSIPI